MKRIAFNFTLIIVTLGLLSPRVALCQEESTETSPNDLAETNAAETETVEMVPSADGQLYPIAENGQAVDCPNCGGGHGAAGHGRGNGQGMLGRGANRNGAYGNGRGRYYCPECQHLRYLLSRTSGHAEYTNNWNMYHASQSPWHGGYYNSQWGRPLALVVPPTADSQTKWGWGVGSTTVVPIYHQFGRGNPAPYPAHGPSFRPTPYWPSHTDQFGVYYVRGPW